MQSVSIRGFFHFFIQRPRAKYVISPNKSGKLDELWLFPIWFSLALLGGVKRKGPVDRAHFARFLKSPKTPLFLHLITETTSVTLKGESCLPSLETHDDAGAGEDI